MNMKQFTHTPHKSFQILQIPCSFNPNFNSLEGISNRTLLQAQQLLHFRKAQSFSFENFFIDTSYLLRDIGMCMRIVSCEITISHSFTIFIKFPIPKTPKYLADECSLKIMSLCYSHSPPS